MKSWYRKILSGSVLVRQERQRMRFRTFRPGLSKSQKLKSVKEKCSLDLFEIWQTLCTPGFYDPSTSGPGAGPVPASAAIRRSSQKTVISYFILSTELSNCHTTESLSTRFPAQCYYVYNNNMHIPKCARNCQWKIQSSDVKINIY